MHHKIGASRKPVFRSLGALAFASATALIIALSHFHLYDGTLNPRVVLQPMLLRDGFVPYLHIADHKAPLLPLSISWLLPLFDGDAVLTARVAHGLLIGAVGLVSTLWAYKVSGSWALVATGAFLFAWSRYFGYLATAYYDLALSPFYFAVFALLMSRRNTLAWRMILAGLATGTGILIKQHAVMLVPVTLAWYVWHALAARINRRQAIGLGLAYALALLLPIIAYAGYHYSQAGSLREFIYWNWTYNLTGDYHSAGSLAPTLGQLRRVLPAFLMLIPLAGSVASPASDLRPSRSTRIWLLIFLLVSASLQYPRYDTRHWATAFPFLATLSAIVCADLARQSSERQTKQHGRLRRYLVIAVILWWALNGLLLVLPRLAVAGPPYLREYSDVVELASLLEDRLPADGGLVLLPTDEGNSNLYYVLRRRPPRYWMMHLPWFMGDYTNRRWLDAVEEEKPATLIYFTGRADLAKYAPEILAYVAERYQAVDAVQWQGSEVRILARQGDG